MEVNDRMTRRWEVSEISQIGSLRRDAVAIAQRLDFGEEEIGKLALVISELGTNLIKHATGGEILINQIEHDRIYGLEIISLDRGPGMDNLYQSFSDGYSTANTLGNGLGAIKRLSTECDVYSRVNSGTILISRIWRKTYATYPHWNSTPKLTAAGVSVPISSETENGDSWEIIPDATGFKIVVVDGLGHGPLAAIAAREALKTACSHRLLPPCEIIQKVHDALRHTRGAVMAVCQIDIQKHLLRFSGVGNISASLYNYLGESKSFASFEGTIGHVIRTLREYEMPIESGQVLVMNTDGILSRARLGMFNQIYSKHPAVIAAAIYQNYRRESDDATVVVAKVLGRLGPMATVPSRVQN